ncbi:MAG TPA: class I SAM-dependent methyltransferase [Thermoanaerobaculia bacterium]|jgi:SAM-dependent methyltransferase|nr:class I SAM-dependent methyltransferase [Thermoanaerobaculia bacterium]
MNDHDVAERLAALYDRRSLQGYVRWKVRTDPAYAAVRDSLRGRTTPLLDLGCGVGLLPLYLREHGHSAPITGIDFDQRKIDVARKAAQGYDAIEFLAGDARARLPTDRDLVILDILHYFDAKSRQTILENASHTKGVVVIRQGIRDGSWRHRLTAFVDGLARVMRWMKAEKLEFPTRDEIVAHFADFDAEIRPLWGRMPYNSYLFVFRRRAAASRPE